MVDLGLGVFVLFVVVSVFLVFLKCSLGLSGNKMEEP